MASKGITVTIRDNATGELEVHQVLDGDYLLVAVSPCRHSRTQVRRLQDGSRTDILTVQKVTG